MEERRDAISAQMGWFWSHKSHLGLSHPSET